MQLRLGKTSMSKVMLITPWNFWFEGKKNRLALDEWRSGPRSLLLLATILRDKDHEVVVVDLARDLAIHDGAVQPCLAGLQAAVANFRPDVVGVTFFSVHCVEVKRITTAVRRQCEQSGLNPLLVAGGIHATVEPGMAVKDLGFDCAFAGEGDIGIIQLAEDVEPSQIPGVVTSPSDWVTRGEIVRDLDTLPFPDWSLCDYRFYDQPSLARTLHRRTRGLDIMASRGCVFQCAFCAFRIQSSHVRFHSARYLVNQMRYMAKEFGTEGFRLVDSSVGNNRKQLREFCELLIAEGLSNRMEWYANVRTDQVNEDLLKLMWRAGCRWLFYGFESGSQRMLDLMHKGTKVEENVEVARLHEKLHFPYMASFIVGYPGETEADLQKTIDLIRQTRPPRCSLNPFTPFPGSPIYDELKARGKLELDGVEAWRRIGWVGGRKSYEGDASYTKISPARLRVLVKELRAVAKSVTRDIE